MICKVFKGSDPAKVIFMTYDIIMNPLKFGGTGGDSKHPYQPDYFPNRYEAGTPNVV